MLQWHGLCFPPSASEGIATNDTRTQPDYRKGHLTVNSTAEHSLGENVSRSYTCLAAGDDGRLQPVPGSSGKQSGCTRTLPVVCLHRPAVVDLFQQRGGCGQ